MLGPGGKSLLAKLGKKAAWQMDEDELRAMVEAEQKRRTIQRAIGRVIRMAQDQPKRRPRVTLESLGFAPEVIAKVREKGVDEVELIKQMQKKGLI